MEKSILLGIFCWLCLVEQVQAQVQKGANYFGGTLGLDGGGNWSKAEKYHRRNNVLSLVPTLQFGRFFRDNKMFGVEMSGSFSRNYTENSNDSTGANLDSYQRYKLAPYLRHYRPLNSKVALFVSSSVELTYMKRRNGSQGTEKRESSYSGGVRVVPGISYRIRPRFALETDINLLSLGANYESIQNDRNDKNIYLYSGITTSLGNSFTIRAAWYL